MTTSNHLLCDACGAVSAPGSTGAAAPGVAAAPPRARPVVAPAAALGAHTAAVLSEFGIES
jgi:hypothetical protein